MRPRGRWTALGAGRFWAARARGVGPTAARGVRKPCRRSPRRSANGRAGHAGSQCSVLGRTGDSLSTGGTHTSALQKASRASRRWTPGSDGASAALCGSHGGGAGTGHSGDAGGVRPAPGTRASRPRARGASAAVRRWRLRYQDITVTGGAGHVSISVLVADGLHRTAVDVPRLSGGVGGERS